MQVGLLILTVCTLTLAKEPTTGFVLLGALGDLSKKYIWSALLDNFTPELRVFGASRGSKDVGSVQLAEILNTVPGITEKFLDRVEYLQLKKEYHFKWFCEANPELRSLVFYMSIPPSAYVSTSQMIRASCKRKGVRIKVAYEKPFGYDIASSTSLFTELGALFEQRDIYLIDHYLGKSVTQSILPVRRKHVDIESRLNKEGVARVEVTLLETLDCEGRAGYYDTSGVVRDMLQNHATELLSLITCELSGGIVKSKVGFIKSLVVPNQHQIVLAQYDQYTGHVGSASTTPTFASILLTSVSERWAGVPFILSSGKAQGVERKEVVVHFTSGDVLKFSFKPSLITYNGAVMGQFTSSASSNSYIPLIKAVLSGDKVLLPSVDTVRASWALWEPVLRAGSAVSQHVSGEGVVVEAVGRMLVVRNQSSSVAVYRQFVNSGQMVTLPLEEVYSALVQDFIRVVNKKNGAVNIALSGGSSVLGVFKHMVLHRARIPWDRISVWQVDERCQLADSNYEKLKWWLLDHVEPARVHRVSVGSEGCSGVSEYGAGVVMDYVLLGVGRDGHTASLFPVEHVIESGERYKMVRVEASVSPVRVSMRLDYINSSARIVVVVVGEGKGGVIRGLQSGVRYPVGGVEGAVWFVDQALVEEGVVEKDEL